MNLGHLSKSWHGRPKPGWTELAFAVRVTMSAVLSLFVAQVLGLPMPLWSVLTAVIVNQLSSGRSLKTSSNYLLGTIGGSIWGGVVAVLIPHASEWVLLGALVIAVAPPALYSAAHANMSVVPVSAIIVLLMPALGSHGDPLHSAIDRILEVAVGAVIGLAVALLVAPSSAHRQTREAAAQLLEEMAQALADLVAGVLDGMTIDAVNRVQDRIGGKVSALDTVGGEAEQERSMRLSSGAETGSLRRTMLRLRHDLVFLGRAVGLPLNDVMRARLRSPLDDVVAAASAYLRASAAALRQPGEPPSLKPFERALEAYDREVQALRREGSVIALSGEAAERFFAATFALEQMRRNLGDLGRVVGEWRGLASATTR